MVHYVLGRAAFSDPTLEEFVVPARAKHVEAGDCVVEPCDADAGFAVCEAMVKGFHIGGIGLTNSGVFDLKEFRAVVENGWLVGDWVAQHRFGGQFTLAFGAVPDLFDQRLSPGEFDFGAVASGPDVGETCAKGWVGEDSSVCGWGCFDLLQPFYGGMNSNGDA